MLPRIVLRDGISQINHFSEETTRTDTFPAPDLKPFLSFLFPFCPFWPGRTSPGPRTRCHLLVPEVPEQQRGQEWDEERGNAEPACDLSILSTQKR